MLKASNITFYKIMTAGYMTADTYFALKPKTLLSELDINELQNYSNNVIKELVDFIDNYELQTRLYLLEQLEANLSEAYLLLNQLLENANEVVNQTICHIGKKVFLQEYVYGNPECLASRFYINSDNISSIRKFCAQCENAFKIWCAKYVLGGQYTSWSTKDSLKVDTDVLILSGAGFEGLDFISIDSDAVPNRFSNDKPYVLFLYSLDYNEFELFRQYLIALLSPISIRLLNAITYIGIRNFYVNYLYADELKMQNIRNLGKKSIMDFNKVKETVKNFVKENYNLSYTRMLSTAVDDVAEKCLPEKDIKIRSTLLKDIMGETKYSILMMELDKLVSDLNNVRAENVIKNYSGDFIEDFIHENCDIRCLRNVGSKTVKELEVLIAKLKVIMKNLLEQNISELDLFLNEKKFFYGDCFDQFSKEYKEKTGNIPMFHIFENLITLMLRSRDMCIFNQFVPLFEGQEKKTLEQIADETNLTRERVRQICVHQCEKLQFQSDEIASNKLNYSKLLSNIEDWQYIIAPIKNSYMIDESYIVNPAKAEGCKLTNEVLISITYDLLRDDFDLIGLKPLVIDRRGGNIWHYSYLINKSITKYFDFNKLMDNVKDFESESIEDKAFSVKEMILGPFHSAWRKFNTDVIEEISRILSQMLIKEFGKIPDKQFRFILEGKKKEKSVDILYRILAENGNPMSPEEVYNSSTILRNRFKTFNSLKHLAYQDPRISMIGKANLMGLIEWDHIKFEGIRGIIQQYLMEFDNPQPIDDIIRHVQKFRDTSDNSIRSTMSGKQFVSFGNGLWGLKSKTYDTKSFVDNTKKRSLDVRISELESFLKNEGRFPSYNADNPEERSLYHWWIKFKKDENLTVAEQTERSRILSTYKFLPSSRKNLEWEDLCSKYKYFFKTNKYMPRKNVDGEHELFLWFNRTKNDYMGDFLNPNQERQFIELCKLL